jgi:hypothetical protein
MSEELDIGEAITNAIDLHMKDDHYEISKEEVGILLTSFEKIKDEHLTNRELLSHIAIAVQGVPEKDFQGHVIGYSGGIQNDVRWLKKRGNGGKGFSVRTRDKLAIGLIAAIPSIMLVVVAYLQGAP